MNLGLFLEKLKNKKRQVDIFDFRKKFRYYSSIQIKFCFIEGRCPSWSKGSDCKSAGFAYAGSNPARPNKSLKYYIET